MIVEAKHFLKDELLWELRYRGAVSLDDPEVLVKTVAELSVMLGELLAIENAGEAPEYPKFAYDYAREAPIAEEKYRVLLKQTNNEY